jgi:hypothetical protein
MGATPEQAQAYVAQHETMAGRRGPIARAEMASSFENLPPPPKASTAQGLTQPQALESLRRHEEAQMRAHLNASNAPPADASGYPTPPLENATPEQLAGIGATKAAFLAVGMDSRIGGDILQSATQRDSVFRGETAEQQSSRLQSTAGSLQRLWGDQFAQNLATVDAYLEQMTQAASPEGRPYIERMARNLSAFDVDKVFQVARVRLGSLAPRT